MKILWHKHYYQPNYFFSVGSGHHDKYSYEIPHECLSSWGNLQGKQFKLNVITSLIWDFFQMAISFFAYVATFSGQLHFWRNYFSTLLQSNNFDTTVTFSEQLFLQSCYFSEKLPFSELSPLRCSHFFRIATVSEQNFYRAATFWE